MYRIVNVDSSSVFPYAKYYLSGNYVDGSAANTNNNWSGASMLSGKASDTAKSKVTVPFLGAFLPSSTDAAPIAYDNVLAGAGATLPRRDTLDRRIANDVLFRVGRSIDVQGGYPHATPYSETVNAWPTLASATAPTDTDHDGMPDAWEIANGSAPNNALDRGNIAPNGYTLLENYLNSITLVSPEIYFSGVLNNFSQTSASPSVTQTVAVSGLNLTGNVTINPPAGFEVSNDGGTNWYSNSNPLIIAPVGGILASFTLSIRLNTTTAGNYPGNIVTSTNGVGDFYLKVTGVKQTLATILPASATWTLLSNQLPTVTGNITATNQALSPTMVGISYNSTFGGIAGWQRSGTTSFLPLGYDAGTYNEYTVTPTDGRTLTVSSVALSALGGGTNGARMAIYYSLDGFVTSSPVGTVTYNGTTSPGTVASSVALLGSGATSLVDQQIATIPTTINVSATQTLSIRVFPWVTGAGNRYFASQNVSITGTTRDVSLPLNLLNLSASMENGQGRLAWKTTNEINLLKFEIERSTDGRTFGKVGELSAKNLGAGANYSFLDIILPSGSVYYRLKMIDMDGASKYSYIAAIDNRNAGSISIYPNPVENIFTIQHIPVSGNMTASIMDATGKKVRSIIFVQGSSQTTVSANNLLPGSYYIKLTDAKSNSTIKFIKR